MWIITLVAVIAVVLLQVSGGMPKSSVGGPMTIMLVCLAGMLVVGLYEAWLKKRGIAGWIVSIVVALAGGFVGVNIASILMEMILPHLHLNGSLVSSGHPFLFVSLAATVVLALQGSWLALKLVDRIRPRFLG